MYLEKLQTSYQNGDKSEATLFSLVSQLAKSGQPYDVYFKEYLATQSAEKLVQEKNAKLIFELTNSINSPAIDNFQQLKKYYAATFGMESYQRKVKQIASQS